MGLCGASARKPGTRHLKKIHAAVFGNNSKYLGETVPFEANHGACFCNRC